MTRYVYRFGGGISDGGQGDRNLLGGKGANLAEMASIGLPVPPGFTISTEMCAVYYQEGESFPASLREEGRRRHRPYRGDHRQKLRPPGRSLAGLRPLRRPRLHARHDGHGPQPRLNDRSVEGLAAASGDPRFAWDSYRRFIQMYADVVLGLDHGAFEEALEIAKEDKGVHLDTDLEAADLQRLVAAYKDLVEELWSRPFPQDVHEQLWGAVGAVFGSWQSERAKTYRRLQSIPGDWGTAVNVQAMVFGNMGETSATGVAFTRDPSTGEAAFYGEYLINAQGEDVVAGIRTPQYLTLAARRARRGQGAPRWRRRCPRSTASSQRCSARSSATIATCRTSSSPWNAASCGCCRPAPGKRTAKAALKIASTSPTKADHREKRCLRVDPSALDQLLHPDARSRPRPRHGHRQGPARLTGAASGRAVFDSDTRQEWSEQGEKVILVRIETSPEDIHGMHAAQGILTARGGMTSHAAVVARGMGRPCVSAPAASPSTTSARRCASAARSRRGRHDHHRRLDRRGDARLCAHHPAELVGDFGVLMEWADAKRRPARAHQCRDAERLPRRPRIRRGGIGPLPAPSICSSSPAGSPRSADDPGGDGGGRRLALAKLLPEQRSDFAEIFRIMHGLPVTIRLLDPPLHEFLPQSEEEFADVAEAAGVTVETLRQRAGELHEFNPMLGHRGCRLGITYPEIYEMQARAIFEAAVEVARDGEPPLPEVMVPLVGTAKELAIIKQLIDRTAATVFEEQGLELAYLVGTMIELPRAALRAGDIAHEAEFFSFGTNDLTQTTLGVSRDDAARFLTRYVEKGIYERDPFVSIDIEGVGELISLAAERGRVTRSDIKLGICGEHGGDPASIAFCDRVGLDYVSASPYRVPIARLAAAQAALREL
jgi:pyruvate,orthophosphate dikinase